MKNTLLLALIIQMALTVSAQKKDNKDTRLQGIEPEIKLLIDQHHAAGLAVAVIQHGRTIYSKGFGYRDYEKKMPVDENTVFGIGSCTKAFTASVLGILQEEGKLDFYDRPNQHLKNLEFSTPGKNDSIRIHHLLTHTTGLSSTPSESTAVLFIPSDKYELIPRIKYINSSSGVGQDWIYNNLMYSVAGMISEQSTGKSLAYNWRKMIFNPLEMTNTYADHKDAIQNSNFSLGYAVENGSPSRVIEEDMSVRGAGGSIFSTVADMSKWMQLWLDKGQYHDQQILPKKYIEAATDTIALLPSNPNQSVYVPRYYGYGWGNWYHKGYKRTEHAGGVSGYVSNVVLYPNEKLGIVVLCNQTASSLPSKVSNLIIEKLYPELAENETEIRFSQTTIIDPINTPTISDSIQAPSYELEDLIGTYHHPGFGEIDITLKGKTMYASMPYAKFRLEYIGDDIFIDHFTERLPHTYWSFLDFKFEKDQNETAYKLLLNLDTTPVVFNKQNR